MKILIMGFTKMKFMPYMNFYLQNIDLEKNDVHVLYWNRDLQPEDMLDGVTFHEFRCYQEDDVSKLSKLSSFSKYRKYARKIIREGQFDFICVLHTLPGVLIADELKKRYAQKFILDYRDSTYEMFAPFKKAVANLVKNSYATFVSSDGFRKYLPAEHNEKIYTSHNLLRSSLAHREDRAGAVVPSDKIRIAFWGFIRHEDINLHMIRRIAADSRFELHYYGREQQVAEQLKKYVADNGIQNVFFHGEYKPEDRYTFILHTDMIHNIYYDTNTMLAMGNKYYDGAMFRIPQLCMSGSFMGQMAEEKGIGFTCDPRSDSFTEDVYRYYQELDMPSFYEACDAETARVVAELDAGSAVIKKVCESGALEI